MRIVCLEPEINFNVRYHGHFVEHPWFRQITVPPRPVSVPNGPGLFVDPGVLPRHFGCRRRWSRGGDGAQLRTQNPSARSAYWDASIRSMLCSLFGMVGVLLVWLCWFCVGFFCIAQSQLGRTPNRHMRCDFSGSSGMTAPTWARGPGASVPIPATGSDAPCR